MQAGNDPLRCIVKLQYGTAQSGMLTSCQWWQIGQGSSLLRFTMPDNSDYEFIACLICLDNSAHLAAQRCAGPSAFRRA